jgi:hypothetical protein
MTTFQTWSYRQPYLIRISPNVSGATGGHACAGGGGGSRGDGGGVAGREGGADGLSAGAELGAGAGASACLPARSPRIGPLSFMWACPIYRSNSWAFALRFYGGPAQHQGPAGPHR